jgi:hypothetical protein
MNKYGKATLLAGASALALGLAASQAAAFDDVDWEWNTTINEKINLYIDPSFWQLDPIALIQVETLQISIGDIKATSEVKHVYNNVAPNYGEYQEIAVTGYTTGDLEVAGTVDENAYVNGNAYGKVKVEGYAKDDCWWGKCDYDPVSAKGFAKLDVHGKAYTDGLPVSGTATGELGVVGTAWLPVIEAHEITDLAHVVSAATAVANIATVTGNSAVFVHDGQFAFGGIGHKYGGVRTEYDSLESLAGDAEYNSKFWEYDPIDNTHHDLVEIGLVAAALGLIQSADIDATSNVYAIENASVDSSATAIANMHSIDVEAASATDAMVVADLVQFSYADVTASSHVAGVSADHYSGLGALDADGNIARPLVNSVATAVGNISTITVGVTPAP